MGLQRAIVGAVAISLGAFALWLAYRFAIAFAAANPTTQSAIVAALVALGTLTFTYWKEKSRSLKEAHREKKIEVYSEFYDIVFLVLRNTKDDIPVEGLMESSDFKDAMFRLMRNVVFYGSPEVVLAFSMWKSESAAAEVDGLSSIRLIGRILLAMRSDIGLSNRGLTEINIHQVYVSDDLTKLGING